jgi:CDP-glucose 4,6-dehydratase
MIDLDLYRSKRVLVTGSRGFKGTHAVNRLLQLGAIVTGYDLVDGDDVLKVAQLAYAIKETHPEIVLHLAAQAFVQKGYAQPIATWETNVMGAANLLGLLRLVHWPCAIVVVTSDKVYGATGDRYADETFPLHGLCPYSASKVAVERVAESFRASFGMRIATARAGNVIGPGDSGPGRLVPSAIARLRQGLPVQVFNPAAIRPWQYVADVVEGYLLLGAALHSDAKFGSAWNFGPERHYTVADVVRAVIRAWGEGTSEIVERELHEVTELRIDSRRARFMLGWRPKWGFDTMIAETVEVEKRRLT